MNQKLYIYHLKSRMQHGGLLVYKILLCIHFHDNESAALEMPCRYYRPRAMGRGHSTLSSQQRQNFSFQAGVVFTSCLIFIHPLLYNVFFKKGTIKLYLIKQKIAFITSKYLCTHCLSLFTKH